MIICEKRQKKRQIISTSLHSGRTPDRTVLYRVLFHHFERFVAEYGERFEKVYGYFRPIIKDVVEKYFDCGNPRCGFARIRCPRCRAEHLLMFLLRIFFKFKRRLLGDLCRCAVRALLVYFQATTCKTVKPGVVAVIQTFGDRINFHPHLHFLVTEGGVDGAGVFQRMSSFDDARLAEVFAREVLRFLVGRELLSPEWAERLLSWRHTGFSVHSRVRAKTKPEAERVGKYMIRAVLS